MEKFINSLSHDTRRVKMTKEKQTGKAENTVFVSTFTDGILDPKKQMLGPVRDGGTIIANTAPGCWGPMITPSLKGGHEVTQPVAVENAEPGDAVAIRIRDITVTSIATASGHDEMIDGYFLGDPYVAAKCPNCDKIYPEIRIEGTGPDSIRCVNCGKPVTPFRFAHGYTVVFDKTGQVGVTVNKTIADQLAKDPKFFSSCPDKSQQASVLLFAPTDLVGVVARMRPFLGQLGSTPAVPLPDSHNAGDFGSFLIGAPHEYAVTEEQLEYRTDGHMDIDAVRPGTILLVPVKVPGGGIYIGDMHALQGDGEIAGHTMDVAGTVTLQVEVVKGCRLDGPVLFPLVEDLPYLARPLTAEEIQRARALAQKWGLLEIETSAPISVIGTGGTLNAAAENGLNRAAALLNMSVAEVRNRATITGAIEIGRLPGVIQVTFLAPLANLEQAGLLPFVKEAYNLD
jgi:formamidase